jgi:hypothetical protein
MHACGSFQTKSRLSRGNCAEYQKMFQLSPQWMRGCQSIEFWSLNNVLPVYKPWTQISQAMRCTCSLNSNIYRWGNMMPTYAATGEFIW